MLLLYNNTKWQIYIKRCNAFKPTVEVSGENRMGNIFLFMLDVVT